MSSDPTAREVTLLLQRSQAGDEEAHAQLFELVYAELRKIASNLMRHERRDHTLTPTAVVNEAYIRLYGNASPLPPNRRELFAVCATVFRHILTDHARRRNRAKRGGGARKVVFDEEVQFAFDPRLTNDAGYSPHDVAEMLWDLEKLDPQATRICEMRFFGGLSIEDCAEVLGISRATVVRRWKFAKRWVYDALQAQGRGPQ
jgi:RNA polymerase sigma factor (TIGR02999 family)